MERKPLPKDLRDKLNRLRFPTKKELDALLKRLTPPSGRCSTIEFRMRLRGFEGRSSSLSLEDAAGFSILLTS
jgi:hypothetical protein